MRARASPVLPSGGAVLDDAVDPENSPFPSPPTRSPAEGARRRISGLPVARRQVKDGMDDGWTLPEFGNP